MKRSKYGNIKTFATEDLTDITLLFAEWLGRNCIKSMKQEHQDRYNADPETVLKIKYQFDSRIELDVARELNRRKIS